MTIRLEGVLLHCKIMLRRTTRRRDRCWQDGLGWWPVSFRHSGRSAVSVREGDWTAEVAGPRHLRSCWFGGHADRVRGGACAGSHRVFSITRARFRWVARTETIPAPSNSRLFSSRINQQTGFWGLGGALNRLATVQDGCRLHPSVLRTDPEMGAERISQCDSANNNHQEADLWIKGKSRVGR